MVIRVQRGSRVPNTAQNISEDRGHAVWSPGSVRPLHDALAVPEARAVLTPVREAAPVDLPCAGAGAKEGARHCAWRTREDHNNKRAECPE